MAIEESKGHKGRVLQEAESKTQGKFFLKIKKRENAFPFSKQNIITLTLFCNGDIEFSEYSVWFF